MIDGYYMLRDKTLFVRHGHYMTQNPASVMFVHGILSGPKAWVPMANLLRQDPDIAGLFALHFFEYSSPRLCLHPLRRIPNLQNVADSFATFLRQELKAAERLVIVTHSQGGLIVQRYLSQMIADGKGLDLARIRRIILFACPNEGSEIALSVRKWWSVLVPHNQEVELRPLAEQVADAHRRVLNSIVHVQSCAVDRCPIPIQAFAGEIDNIVTPASAQSVFPQSGTLPGDHFAIIRPKDRSCRQYTSLRSELLIGLKEPFPRISASEEKAFASSPGPNDVFTELETFPCIPIRIGPHTIPFSVHAGPIDQIAGIDVVVSSENIFFEMAKPFKASTSGRLRRASAKKNAAGEIVEDTVFDELNAWMKINGKHGLAVPIGTVAATSSGEMARKGIRRIYHAAVVIPRIGTNDYNVDPEGLAHAVHNTLALAREERARLGLMSICFPLFGAGRGKLSPDKSIAVMWPALKSELSMDPNWHIHFCTWRRDETEILLKHLHSVASMEGTQHA